MATIDPPVLNHFDDITIDNTVSLNTQLNFNIQTTEVIVDLDEPHGAIKARLVSKSGPQNGPYEYRLRFYIVGTANHPNAPILDPVPTGMTIIVNDGGVVRVITPENPIAITDAVTIIAR